MPTAMLFFPSLSNCLFLFSAGFNEKEVVPPGGNPEPE